MTVRFHRLGDLHGFLAAYQREADLQAHRWVVRELRRIFTSMRVTSKRERRAQAIRGAA